MKGILFVSSAIVSLGLGMTPAIAGQPEAASEYLADNHMDMEAMMEGEVERVTETSIFPGYDLIVVSGPGEDKYYTFYAKDADLEVGDEVYFSDNLLYLDDEAQTVIAESYMMTRKAYYDSVEAMSESVTVVEERRVEMEDDVIVDRPQVERRTTVYEAQPTRVKTRPDAPVRGLW
ncbi:MAG: hypothetical protein ACFB4I_02080 [Cyanophyceae cyanobacterium]